MEEEKINIRRNIMKKGIFKTPTEYRLAQELITARRQTVVCERISMVILLAAVVAIATLVGR